MEGPPDPLAHLPDPDQRFQVFGFARGLNVWVQILDSETGQGMVLDMVTAMEVVRDINSEMVRVLGEIHDEFQRQDETAGDEPEGLAPDGESWQPPGW